MEPPVLVAGKWMRLFEFTLPKISSSFIITVSSDTRLLVARTPLSIGSVQCRKWVVGVAMAGQYFSGRLEGVASTKLSRSNR
jgi:hypothetical protein